MMYFLSYVNFADPTTETGHTLCGFVPAVAVLNCMRIWARLEDFGIGVKFSSLGVRINGYAYGISLWLLIVDMTLYFVIYWYLDQVAPYGTGHRHPLFLFMPEYWKQCFGKEVSADRQSLVADSQQQSGFEAPSAACQQLTLDGKTLEVRGLQKTFKAQGRTIAAVDNVNFSMYPGEIYILLGHNGAGKTTSISCLTGLIRRTAGTATLFGQSLWSALGTSAGRKQIGICPQHNVLWNELTCLEHVQIFGAFRGMSRAEANAAGQTVLADCGLSNKMREFSGKLSGGMKRKLCLALALVGEPRLCFLDEPSSGMDPTARRDTWDLLRRQKENKIMVLTTHYMDEADVLGDRIGIMSHGQMQCLGSPIFLKQHYGCGYNLALDMSDKSKMKECAQFIIGQLGGDSLAKVLSEAAGELVLLIDFAAAGSFPKLFTQLDSEETKKRFSLQGWGISVCHLEEVFLRVAGGKATKSDTDIARSDSKTMGTTKVSASPSPEVVGQSTDDNQGGGDVDVDLQPNPMRQLAVMLQKRARYTIRDPMLLFCQVLCPGFALLVIFLVMQGFFADKPRLELNLDMFNERTVDEGQPGNIVPHAAITASMADVGGSVVGLGVADQSPRITLDPTQHCTDTTDYDYTAVLLDENFPDRRKREFIQKWGCIPDGATGTGKRLGEYVHSLGCGLLSTKDDQMASRYLSVLPVAADSSEGHLVLMANLTGVHIAPVATNVGSNVLRQKAGKTGQIKVATHPLPVTKTEKEDFFGGDGIVVMFALIVPAFIFPFPTAFSAAYVIREKETGVKAQHLMSGVGIVTYWAACILSDLIIFSLAIAFVFVPCAIFNVSAMLSGEILLAYIIFVFAQIPFGYLVGSLVNKAATAQNMVLAMNMGVTSSLEQLAW
jgi:ABC-type multidrug transport system ATPase subunit